MDPIALHLCEQYFSMADKAAEAGFIAHADLMWYKGSICYTAAYLNR